MSAVGRTLTITMLGDTRDLEAALERAGIVAADSSKDIQKAASQAGAAAAEQAKAMGLSADQQEAAAARAAGAYVDGQKRISTAQSAAATAAAETAKAAGLSADEQVDAAGRAAAAYVEGQKQITAAMGAASAAAASAAKSAGMTADEQVAAADRAVAAQRAIASAAEASAAAQEVAAAKAADVAKKAADAQEAAAARAAASHKSVLSVGKYAGGAAVVTAAFSVKGAVDLQKDMELIHTEAGATQAQVDKLTGGILKMAPAVATGPGALAAGMYHVVSSLNATLPAATRSATELRVLQIAAEGAKTGGADLVDVTNALDAAVVSGISGVHNYGSAMGALNSIVGAGDMTMQDLADAFGKGVAVNAKLAGVSLNQLGGTLAVLGDNNIRGAAAGTLMSSTLRIMKAPSEAAAGALGLINISSTQLADDMRSGGIIKALEDLKTHLQESGATASQQGIILTRAFGGRQSTGVSILLDQLDRLKAKTDQVAKGGSSFGADYEATTQTMAFKTQELEATVEKLGDQFGEYLIPKLEDVADETEQVIGWFGKHQTAAEALAGVIGGVLGLTVATYAGDRALKFIAATKDMGSGLMVMSGKATAAATSIGVKFGLMSGEADTAAGAMTEADDEIVASAETTAAGVDTALGATGVGLILVGLGAAAIELHDHWSEVMSGMETEVNVMVEGAESALDGLISALNAAISVFNSTLGHLTGDIGKVGKVGVSGVFNTGGGGPDSDAIGGADLSPAALKAAKAGNISGFSGSEKATAAQLEQLLTSRGLSKAGAAGLIGNFAQESTENPSMDSPGNGMGLASWTGSRASGEQAYANQQKLPWNSLTAQVGFILHELQGHTALLKLLQTTNNPVEAAKLVALQYEAPAPKTANYAGREKWAQEVDAAFGGAAATSASAISRSPTAASSKQLDALQQKLQKQLNDLGKTYSGETPEEKKKALAAATSTIPASVVAMLSTAQALLGTRYTHGGGHGSTFDPIAELKKVGVDCSGFVSAVLHGGGVSLSGPLTTSGLAGALQKGKGDQGVTVYDRAAGSQAHTIIDILGHYFESGGNPKFNPAGGVSALTQAQAAGELAGGGFAAYHPILPKGKDASKATLSAAGISEGAVAADQNADIENVVATYLAKERAAIEKALQALATKGDTLLTKYQSATQNGSVASLEKAIGVNSSTMLLSPTLSRAEGRSGGSGASQWAALQHLYNATQGTADRYRDVTRNKKSSPVSQWNALQGLYDGQHTTIATPESAGERLTKESDRLGVNATTAQIERRLLPTLNQASKGSAANAKYESTVSSLTEGAGNRAGLTARQTRTLTRDVETGAKLPADLSSKLAAAHVSGLVKIADKLVVAHKTAMDSLAQNVYAANLESLARQDELTATQVKDQTTLSRDVAQAQLTVAEAMSQRVTDAMTAAATGITDQTQKITDSLSGMATAIQDATSTMADTSNAAVAAINDNSQTKVDILGERGLYGLNLIAQQEKVQLDQMKSGFDAQIAVAQANVDQTKATWDATIAGDQVAVDQVQLTEDQLVAQAQQNYDTVTIAQDTRIATATAHADSVQLANDIKVQLAQTAVTLSASSTKAQQNVAASRLDAYTGQADSSNAVAQDDLQNVTNDANQKINDAQNAYNTAQGVAAVAIANAQGQLATAQGLAGIAEANAQQALTGIQDAAAVAEAGAQATINETSEAASTQFAGTGTVVNVYGIPAENAAAVGDAVDWVARTQLQLAS